MNHDTPTDSDSESETLVTSSDSNFEAPSAALAIIFKFKFNKLSYHMPAVIPRPSESARLWQTLGGARPATGTGSAGLRVGVPA